MSDVIHKWLKYHYGKPTHCESTKCTGISKTYDYALKKGYKHAKNRKHYKQLCRSCHMRYDKSRQGIHLSVITKGRISEGLKLAYKKGKR